MSPRRRLAFVVVALGVIWACGGDDPSSPNSPTQPASASPSPPMGLAFGSFVNVHGIGRSSAGEPSLQISRNGTLWSTDLGPAQIWTSSDRGATWTFIAPPSLGGGGDMDAAQDDSGRVHVVDLGSSTACVLYYRTQDAGKTFDVIQSTSGGGAWVSGSGACGPSNKVDRPWVATWGANTVYVVYKDEGNRLPGVDASVDGGQTFTHAPPFSFPEPQGLALDPTDGSVYVIGEELDHFDTSLGRSVGRTVRVAGSRDGRTFSTSLVFDGQQFDVAAGGFPTIAVDAGHNVYATWSDNSAGTVDVYLSVSHDRGTTWSAPIRVSHDLNVSAFPTVVAGDAGRVGIAWYATADSARSYNNAPGASWYVYAAVSVNGLDGTPSFDTARVSDQPFHHDSICPHVNVCEGVDVTNGQQPPDYARKRRILDFFRLAVDPTGALDVVWADTATTTGEDHFARQVSGSFLKAMSIAPTLTAKLDRINALSRQAAVERRETAISESELNTYFPRLAREQISSALMDPAVTLLDANHVTLRATVLAAAARASLVIDGTLTTENGYGRFAIRSALIGGAPVPSSMLESVLRGHADSDGDAGWHLGDSFPLPAAIRGLRVNRGQLVVIQ